MTAQRRYPLAPLIEAVAGTGETDHSVLARLGVSGSTAKKYRAEGVLERTADRLAVRAGLHPFEVWPELVDDALAELDAPPTDPTPAPPVAAVACPLCATSFTPRPTKVYCSPRCRETAGDRRRYAQDPQRYRERSSARYARRKAVAA